MRLFLAFVLGLGLAIGSMPGSAAPPMTAAATGGWASVQKLRRFIISGGMCLMISMMKRQKPGWYNSDRPF